jgi:hypothetical protein
MRGAMNKKEDFFRFSRLKQKFFDAYYKKKGWPYRRIQGSENRRYNCLVEINGKKWKFEEKSRTADYDDFLVEIKQDIKTGDPGWLYYCEADYILYSTPKSFYAIRLSRLREFVKKNGANYPIKISKKGWGETMNIAIPWADLISQKIAQKIRKEEY